MLPRNRCVIPVNGFYEFKNLANKKKQPYYLHQEGDEPLFLAGLYDTWRSKENCESYELQSFTILTMDASQRILWLHDRQPLILCGYPAVKRWLDLGDDPASVLSAARIQARDPRDLKWHAVTNQINKASYQGSDCSIHVDKRKGSLVSFFKPSESSTHVKAETSHSRAISVKSSSNTSERNSVKIESARLNKKSKGHKRFCEGVSEGMGPSNSPRKRVKQEPAPEADSRDLGIQRRGIQRYFSSA